MVYQHPSEEDYDLAILLARRERVTQDLGEDSTDIEIGEIPIRKAFFKDLRKACRRIKPKPSLKQSGT